MIWLAAKCSALLNGESLILSVLFGTGQVTYGGFIYYACYGWKQG